MRTKYMSLHCMKSNGKIYCDVYYTNIDLTSLRWLTEVKNVIIPFINIFELKFHKHTTNSIKLNGKKIEFHNLRRIIFEFASQFINEHHKTINHSIIN